MRASSVRVGNGILHPPTGEVTGDVVELDGEAFYRIEGLDGMPPFLITVVSDSDHWMFVSSTGALTAGRRSVESSLFPYTTEDKIHDSVDITGPRTLIRVDREGEHFLWEPFSPRFAGAYRIRRSLYKSVLGNRLVFEEHNTDLALTFRYQWAFSDAYGIVRRAELRNDAEAEARIQLLDGLQNLLPAGVDPVGHALGATCFVERHDAAMRELALCGDEERAGGFDRLRRDYPVRRDFQAWRVHCADPSGARALGKLGFRVQPA